ncbi:hypothetical protein BGW80DRAFT_1331561 [Lactifluus volemus]|nr:hypothetical protein BGW80DRAFT_1331561 [Lactifluus volemus]
MPSPKTTQCVINVSATSSPLTRQLSSCRATISFGPNSLFLRPSRQFIRSSTSVSLEGYRSTTSSRACPPVRATGCPFPEHNDCASNAGRNRRITAVTMTLAHWSRILCPEGASGPPSQGTVLTDKNRTQVSVRSMIEAVVCMTTFESTSTVPKRRQFMSRLGISRS